MAKQERDCAAWGMAIKQDKAQDEPIKPPQAAPVRQTSLDGKVYS